MDDFKLIDLIDIGMLQRLADSNFIASGLPMTIIDASDTSILVRAGWPDLCLKFHRVHPVSEARCRLSDSYVGEHLGEAEFLQYKCRNGMWHVAIPIVVSGRHLATLFLTQFFFEDEQPDKEFFTRQAAELGFDLDNYLAALDRTPVFSREKVDYVLAYYKALMRFISDLAEQSVKVMRAKRQLSESEEKYRTLVNNVNIGVFRRTIDGKFIQMNPAMANIFGYDSVEEAMQVNAAALYQDQEQLLDFIKQIKTHGVVKNGELALRKRDGTCIWCSSTVTAQYDQQGEILCLDGVLEDITARRQAREELQKAREELEARVVERTAELVSTNERLLSEIAERKRVESKLRDLSENDPLTEIFNRRKLFDLLGHEVEMARRYGRPLALLMFDLDHFKQVNDTFGHDIGDMVLKTTARIVKKIIRKTDIFARYGGEEFIIAMLEMDSGGAVPLAEKIRSAIEHHHFFDGDGITVSIGVAVFTADDSIESLIKKTDDALYVAKKTGRNRVDVWTNS